MPQASDELRAYWGGPDDATALAHLKKQGYTLNGDWTWSPPEGVTLETMPERDFLAIIFMRDEWDYGTLRKGPADVLPLRRD